MLASGHDKHIYNNEKTENLSSIPAAVRIRMYVCWRHLHQSCDKHKPSRPDGDTRRRRLLLSLRHGRHTQSADIPLARPHRLAVCGHGVHRRYPSAMEQEGQYVGTRHKQDRRQICALLLQVGVGRGMDVRHRSRYSRPPGGSVHRPRTAFHKQRDRCQEQHRPVLHRGQRPQISLLGLVPRHIRHRAV